MVAIDKFIKKFKEQRARYKAEEGHGKSKGGLQI